MSRKKEKKPIVLTHREELLLMVVLHAIANKSMALARDFGLVVESREHLAQVVERANFTLPTPVMLSPDQEHSP